MSEETTKSTQEQSDQMFENVYDFLATLPNAPTPAQISGYKQQAPGGRVKLFTPDAKRAFIVRGISGYELSELAKNVPQNATDPELELKLAICAKATIWTNTTANNLLDPMTLKSMTAGLPDTLHQLISRLSDFFDPIQLNAFSGDL